VGVTDTAAGTSLRSFRQDSTVLGAEAAVPSLGPLLFVVRAVAAASCGTRPPDNTLARLAIMSLELSKSYTVRQILLVGTAR
jgi:hypothetical protein